MSEVASATGSNVTAHFLPLFRWCYCGASLSTQIIPALFQESETYSLRVPVLDGISSRFVRIVLIILQSICYYVLRLAVVGLLFKCCSFI